MVAEAGQRSGWSTSKSGSAGVEGAVRLPKSRSASPSDERKEPRYQHRADDVLGSDRSWEKYAWEKVERRGEKSEKQRMGRREEQEPTVQALRRMPSTPSLRRNTPRLPTVGPRIAVPPSDQELVVGVGVPPFGKGAGRRTDHARLCHRRTFTAAE